MPFHDDDNSLPESSTEQQRVALVIGNGAYAHASPLANPSSDAGAITAKLQGLGFEVFSGVDLGYQQLGKMVVEFEQAIKGADVALLFYAGHGLQVHGKNYLVPVDAKIEGVAELKFSTILFDDILEPMTRLSKASLVFLDACRDNPFARNISRSLGQRNVSGGLAEIKAASGSFIAFATAPDKVAFDGHGDNSPFTSAFLRHVDTPGLSLSDVMIDVRNSVLDETNGKQEPWDQSSLRSRFYFVPEVPKPVLPEALPVPAEQLEVAAAWRDIQHSTHLGQLTVFRDKCKNAVYAGYADLRINELREADERARAEKEAQRQHEEQARHAEQQKEAEARARDDGAFAKARGENNVVAFKSYMSAWPQGAYLVEAKAAIKGLRPSLLKPLLTGVSVIALLAAGVLAWQKWPEPVFQPVVKKKGVVKKVEITKPPVVAPVGQKTRRKSYVPETVLIPGGTFSMGCVSGKDCSGDEKPVHGVTVGSFYLSKYETTFAQWDAAQDDKDWKKITGLASRKPNDRGWGRGKRPVIYVSWDDAVAYAKWLSKKTGQTWRLPREAEWEYAARAGSDKKYSWGNSIGKNKANCDDCGSQWDDKKTAPVGSFSANGFGLHDMHGNVWEWVHDWKDKYSSGSQTDPKGPSSGSYRVSRGGSWGGNAGFLRSANRSGNSPDFRNFLLGFRLLRQP